VRLAIPRPKPPHSLSGPYALDALDDAGQDRFQRHLRVCGSCRDGVRGFATVVAALAEAAAVTPPASLRDQVLAAVSVTRQLPPKSVKSRASIGGRAGREIRGTGSARLPRSTWLPRLALAAGAAGLATSAVLGGITVSAWHERSAAEVQAQAIAAVLAAPDARLVSAPTSLGGSVTVVTSVRQGMMVFISSGLRPPAGSRVYQLWLIGTTIRSAGLIPAVKDGKTAPVLASGLAAGDKIGVTIEPAGGSSAPTTTPIVLLSLPSFPRRSRACGRLR
jgi:anti-sigma-K factor RskA